MTNDGTQDPREIDEAFADLRRSGADAGPEEIGAIADGVAAGIRAAGRPRWGTTAAAAALIVAGTWAAWNLGGRGQAVTGTVRIAPTDARDGTPREIETDRWIRVPPGSRARLELLGGGTAIAGGDALLRIRGRREDERVVLDLAQGSAWFEGEPGSPGFEVRLPGGSVREIGTAYGIRILELAAFSDAIPGGTQGTIVEVACGEVEVSNRLGRQRLLPAHVGFLVDGCPPAFRERGTRGAVCAVPVTTHLARTVEAARAGGTGGALRILELAASPPDRATLDAFLRDTADEEADVRDARRMARALRDLEPIPDATR